MPLAPRMPRHSRAMARASRALFDLAQADLLGADEVLVLEPAQVQGQQHALAQLQGHVGQLLLRQLVGGDRLVELLARDAVGDRRLEAVTGCAQRAEDDAVAGLVQARQRAAQSGDLGQDGVGRQSYLVEDQLAGDRGAQRHLRVDLVGGEARRARRDDEAPDALVGRRPHHGHVRDVAVGDPHLRAVEHPVVAVTARAGAHAAGVGAEVGLGQAEAPDRLAGRHPRQPLLLLLLGPEAPRSRTSPASPGR